MNARNRIQVLKFQYFLGRWILYVTKIMDMLKYLEVEEQGLS